MISKAPQLDVSGLKDPKATQDWKNAPTTNIYLTEDSEMGEQPPEPVTDTSYAWLSSAKEEGANAFPITKKGEQQEEIVATESGETYDEWQERVHAADPAQAHPDRRIQEEAQASNGSSEQSDFWKAKFYDLLAKVNDESDEDGEIRYWQATSNETAKALGGLGLSQEVGADGMDEQANVNIASDVANGVTSEGATQVIQDGDDAQILTAEESDAFEETHGAGTGELSLGPPEDSVQDLQERNEILLQEVQRLEATCARQNGYISAMQQQIAGTQQNNAARSFCCWYARTGRCRHGAQCAYIHERAGRIQTMNNAGGPPLSCDWVLTRGFCRYCPGSTPTTRVQ